MAMDLKGYKVFVASPSGLDDLRATIHEHMAWFNDLHANPNHTHFMPVMWERMAGGVGRPQGRINQHLEQCDYCILVLWDRFGSPSDPPTVAKPVFAVEEEFQEACRYLNAEEYPMRDVVVLFKAVDERKLADPGPQLQKVLDFKKRLEASKQHFYHTFDSHDGFRRYLEIILGSWLVGPIRKADSPIIQQSVPYSSHSLQLETIKSTTPDSVRTLLQEAHDFANAGEIVEAESGFARAATVTESPYAINAFGNFLMRVGRLDQAEKQYNRAIQIADERRDDEAKAGVYGNLGLIYQIRGDLDNAEKLYRKDLEIEKTIGRPEGEASDYRKLGIVSQLHGLLDQAEAFYKLALRIDQDSRLKIGEADDHSLMGTLYQIKGDLYRAEEAYTRALQINTESGSQVGIANNLGNLGDIYRLRDELDKAEEFHSKALAINTTLRRKEGMANDIGNLGVIAELRKNIKQAREKYLEALVLDTDLGHQEGIAKNYSRLGRLRLTQKDYDRAESLFGMSLEIVKQMNHVEGLGEQYLNLGDVYRMRGDREIAKEHYGDALKYFKQIRAYTMISQVRTLLKEVE
jgi:tetratricopeptide (TPR) repeat protein